MKSQIVGFVTRADANLRSPTSVSHNITPAKGGVAVHYGGGPQKAAEPNSDHALCISTWRSWQNYHMDSKGYVDVAYTGAFCNHGYAFAGRGAGVRTGANGTDESNQNFYAVVWIGGEGQKPSDEAVNALFWWIVQLTTTGGAELLVKPHKFFKSTGCPGEPFVKLAGYFDGKDNSVEPTPTPTPKPTPTPVPTPTPTPKSTPTPVNQEVVDIQKALQVTADGKWGPNTDKVALVMWGAARATRWWPRKNSTPNNVEQVQKIVGTKVDGIWGPKSQDSMIAWVKKFQTIIGVVSDGLWGVRTDGKFIAVRRRYLNKF